MTTHTYKDDDQFNYNKRDWSIHTDEQYLCVNTGAKLVPRTAPALANAGAL